MFSRNPALPMRGNDIIHCGMGLATERRCYRGEHPTEIAALKCMDGWHCMIFLTCHYSRGDLHHGCRVFNYDKVYSQEPGHESSV